MEGGTMLALIATLISPTATAGTVLLPEASPLEQGHGSAVAQGIANDIADTWSATGMVRARIGVTDRFIVGAHVGPYLYPDPTRLWAYEPMDAHLGGLQMHYNVLQSDSFNLGPWVGAIGAIRPDTTTVYTATGMALEGGGELVRYDLSVPLFLGALSADGATGALTPLILAGSEGGLTFHPHEEHSLRVGATSLIPHLDYRYTADNGIVIGADIGGWLGAQHWARGTIGFRW